MSQLKKVQQRKSLEFNQRLEILKRIDDGETVCLIAQSLGISRSTVSMIKKNREKIEKRKEVLESCGGSFNKKRFRGTEESALDATILKYISDGLTDGPTLQKAAKQFYESHDNSKEFRASAGWLRRFRERHGLTVKRNNNKKKQSVDVKASEGFKSSFDGFMKLSGITNLNCVYCCDETALYWKLLPTQIFSMAAKNGFTDTKQSKSRVSVVVCANASGTHKIPLHVIKKTQTLNAWMTSDIMLDWYENVFIPEVKRHHNYEENKDLRVILIMDDAPYHPKAEEFHKLNEFCTVIFLPPNTSSVLLPMEQGINNSFKRSYRNILLTELLIHQSSVGFNKSYKDFQLSDALQYCTSAWVEISPIEIKSSWKTLIPSDNDLPSSTGISNVDIQKLLMKLPWCESITINATQKWLAADECVPCFNCDLELLNKPYVDENDENLEDNLDDTEGDTGDVPWKDLFDAITLISNFTLKCEEHDFTNIPDKLTPFRKYVTQKLLNDKVFQVV